MNTTTPETETERVQQQIAVVDGIRRAFAKFKHHREFTRRVKPVLEAELPGYTVSVDPGASEHDLRTIRVWGNGLPYNNGSVYLCWGQRAGGDWTTGLVEQIEICDNRDHAERREDEKKLERKLAALQAKVEAARAEAEALVAALPEPKAATIRKGHPTWAGPSSELAAQFPMLFGRI